MSSISLRLVGAVTALFVVGALAPATASPATEKSADKPASATPEGITIGDTAISSQAFTTLPSEPSARAARWPIGGGRANLTVHPETPTGDLSQRFTRVRMDHYRAYGGVFAAVVQLGAAPTEATSSVVRLAFGRISGTDCVSAAGHNIAFTSTDTDTQNNPVYGGATITVKPFRFEPARTASWNCAFAQTLNIADTTTKYDAVAGSPGLFRQTPILTIKTKGRSLKRRGYTKVPITISNSPGTIATAPRVRLSWKTKGVKVKANPRVGTIKPGRAKKGFFYVKDTRRGNGKIVFTVKSRNYQKKLRLTVRETRR